MNELNSKQFNLAKRISVFLTTLRILMKFVFYFACTPIIASYFNDIILNIGLVIFLVLELNQVVKFLRGNKNG